MLKATNVLMDFEVEKLYFSSILIIVYCIVHPKLKYLVLQLGLLLWTYFSVVLTDPGSVPPNWKPVVDEESGETTPLTSMEFSGHIINLKQPGPLTETASPRIRYCRKCNHLKPPRCHHCSVCKTMHLKN